MSMLKATAGFIGLAVLASSAVHAADTVAGPKLGTPMTADDIAKWDTSIFPDGRGLPPGRGTASGGKAVYAQKCASCHGPSGLGGTAEELVSEPIPLTDPQASKAIGLYWPYATTVFDYTRRSMPPSAPGSLTADEVYAVTAYLLAESKVIKPSDEMNEATLPQVKMPNRDGFTPIDAKP